MVFMEYNESAITAPHNGFTFDNAPVESEIAALTSTVEEYAKALETGMVDPDENIQVEEWELEDLLELIAAGKMTDGKTVASILAYAVKYRGRGPERK